MSKIPISQAGSLEQRNECYLLNSHFYFSWVNMRTVLLMSLTRHFILLCVRACVCAHVCAIKSERGVPRVCGWQIYYILWLVCKQGSSQTHSRRSSAGYQSVIRLHNINNTKDPMSFTWVCVNISCFLCVFEASIKKKALDVSSISNLLFNTQILVYKFI